MYAEFNAYGLLTISIYRLAILPCSWYFCYNEAFRFNETGTAGTRA